MGTPGLETLGGEMWCVGNKVLQQNVRRWQERSLWMWKFLVFWAPALMRARYENKLKCKQWNKNNNGRSSASPHGDGANWKQVFLLTDGPCPSPQHTAQQVRRKRSISAPVCPLGLVSSYRKQPAHSNTKNWPSSIILLCYTLYYKHHVI